jgi:Holliday junction DNA helicase RuvA
MIGSLRGVVVERPLRGELLLEVGGVGYRVTVTAATARSLGGPGSPAFVWIHHHFREDHQSLYGFAGRDERDCFEGLLGAHGVGPALALAILSVHSPKELVRILTEDDLAALCLVPGVGRKTAARLVVELKARLDVGSLDALPSAAPGLGSPGTGTDASPLALVRQALAELGYGPDEVRRAVDGLEEQAAGGADPAGNGEVRDESALLRAALRRLGR